MYTADIYKKHVSNFGNDFEWCTVIFNSGYPTGDTRLCRTLKEAKEFARIFNASINDEDSLK